MKTISKAKRILVHEKYGGHCAYCGKAITLKQMQVDHKAPKYHWTVGKGWNDSGADDIDNLMPSCAHCNHYKSAFELEEFRTNLLQLDLALSKTHKIRVAQGFGIVILERWDGVFYFEKEAKHGRLFGQKGKEVK